MYMKDEPRRLRCASLLSGKDRGEQGACEHAGQECAADSTDCNNYSVQITYMSLYRCYILCTAVSTLRAFTGSEAPVLVEVISELM